MTRWDLKQTRENVLRLHGYEQVELIRPCLKSIVCRQDYARYHFQEYKRLLEKSIDSELSEKNIIELTFIPNEESQLLGIQIDANIVAALQNLHCLIDTLVHVVCYACGLNLNKVKPLTERDITAKNLVEHLNSNSDFTRIKDILNDTDSNQDKKYLAALVNHSKHRSIVPSIMIVDSQNSGKLPYKFVFSSFKYNKQTYQEREVDPFLEKIYAWLSEQIVECGNALNDALTKQ